MGLRRGFPTHAIPHPGRGEPWPAIQELGARLPRRQSVLVQRLSRPDSRSGGTQQSDRERLAQGKPAGHGGRDMDAGSLAAPPPAPSWGLADAAAAQTQGFVVTGFGTLPTGRALFLEFKWPAEKRPKGWLDRLQAVAPITTAVRPDTPGSSPQIRAASFAFSGTGLRRMGLP